MKRTGMRALELALGLLAVPLAVGCIARSPEQYRDDTAKLLETKSGEIKDCYDAHIKDETNRNARGSVVVEFKVKEDTGTFEAVRADDKRSTAPAAVQSCVVDAIGDLALKPADAREGDATFTWEFDYTAN
jgi:hypothetical protein